MLKNLFQSKQILKPLGIFCCFALLAGCNPTSNSTVSSNDEKNKPVIVPTDDTNKITPTVAPTGRDTNQTNRLYSPDQSPASTKQPDNTGINARDRSEDALTAENQG